MFHTHRGQPLKTGDTMQEQSTDIDALTNILLQIIGKSGIPHNLDYIPELDYLITNVASYNNYQNTASEAKYLERIQNNLQKIQTYFSDKRERADITQAIAALKMAIDTTLERKIRSAKPAI